MKKVLILNGSPKKVSDTMQLTNAFLKGLTESGAYRGEILNTIDLHIAPCRGCFSCMRSDKVRCVIEDDMGMILEKLCDADLVIWSFPLYCYSLPSHLKAVLDRTLPLSRMAMTQTEDGRVAHVGKGGYHAAALVISGCGFPAWEGNFDALRIQCRNCFGPAAPVICVPETPMMNVPEARIVSDPLRERFTRAGREYAQTGTLCRETIEGLETPMIPREQYLAIVNGNVR